MSQENKELYKHFMRKISRDLFFISAIGWGILFLLESFKTGIVSNYLSLPLLAFIPMILLVIMLVLQQPPAMISHKEVISKKQIIYLVIASIFLIVFLIFLLETGRTLTLLLILASLVSLWLLSFTFSQSN